MKPHLYAPLRQRLLLLCTVADSMFPLKNSGDMYIRDCSNTVVPSLHVWFALYSEFYVNI